ncbi:transposase [Undibacterium amnicola]|uniref:Transposase n=1 Tax=Undibacterium amnicola TaxID=1834038 RepID=A0ABR6XW46_9BURK|nr:transposase [Undibacterium amnicola]MBC3833701.1 transposase [Undibacterium amnicola]
MSRPLRLSFPGAIYHITSRGNARAAIYLDDEDKQRFLALLASCIEKFNWICHAYCLMNNHYHLLIETPDANLQAGMRQLNGVYTQQLNRVYGRVGHVFQGRYKAILVDKESYLLELCRYIVLNPVRANMVEQAEQYVWSSYAATAHANQTSSWLNVDWILSQFSSRKSIARARYRQFVLEGVGQASPWDQLKGQVLMGSEGFVELLRPYIQDAEKLVEVPRAQRLLDRPALAVLFANKVELIKERRDEKIREAHLRFGYSLAEIGRFLNLHYSTVSRIVHCER